MKLVELSEIVSKQSKQDEASVRKALRAAIAILKEQIAKEERFQVQGLGTFIRREGKEPGKSRVVFRPAEKKQAKEEK
jgi:nucleoid DNA-binding protein